MNALVTPDNIQDIVDNRNKAHALWMEAYDSYHRLTDEAANVSIGQIGLYIPATANYGNDGALASAYVSKDREKYEKLMTEALDRSCWKALLNRLGFDAILDRQAREEFAASIRDTPTAFTVENCAATFGDIWQNRRNLYLRGIANTFSSLDRRFRSHNGFKIGARLIIDNAINHDGWWHNSNRRDTLHDVEKIFRDIDGKPPYELNTYGSSYERRRHGVPDMRNWGIVRRISSALTNGMRTPFVIHADYFRVRVFGNGNLHIWFERSDLLVEVNQCLAEYYGEVIGDSYETTEADEAPAYHITPAKNFGAFFTSPEIAQRVINYANIRKGDRVLEPSAGSGQLAKVARDHGADVTCVEIQPGLAHELKTIHGFENVHCGDFLQMTPQQIGYFDLVVANPPFDRGRDVDHCRHALQFVKPGGQLIAIMSARAEYGEDKRHMALHRLIEHCEPVYGRDKWRDLPPGSFAHAGTNVNTVVLAIRKPAEPVSEDIGDVSEKSVLNAAYLPETEGELLKAA